MKKNIYWVVGIVTLVVCGFIVANYFYKNSQKQSSNDPKVNELLIKFDSPSLGPADAPVTIVEFLDPECESCRAMAPVVKQLLKDFEGKVRLVVRYMPLHRNSMLAVSYLEGAREQGKFWEALDALFEAQPEWASHHAPRPELIPVALQSIGLDMVSLKASVESGRHQPKAEQDKKDGNTLGVFMTPSFFINGKQLQGLGYQELKSAIEEAIALK